jgi:hypothetical protein
MMLSHQPICITEPQSVSVKKVLQTPNGVPSLNLRLSEAMQSATAEHSRNCTTTSSTGNMTRAKQ